ncbi:uncharacterized protein LOC122259589 [Penaeus japonicus]|uniref:uncharacterized protein LOC122259589 n=1 Tax=Penaeus japonicus TaxID=27405 RepID=UPI001C712869|nr:uncharacterized protein LOC122259589 [Penaeus japonicus]
MTELMMRFCLLFAVAVNHATCNFLIECPNLSGSGCSFNGTLYNDGDYVENQCLGLRCEGTDWVPTGSIDPLCRKCRVYLDPHLQTSDGYHYSNLQDACNYSLIQRGGSYHPDVAIFADFGKCNGEASCIHSTSFRDSPDVIVEIGRDGLNDPAIYTVYLDDVAFTIPTDGVSTVLWSSVLAWRFGDSCIRLVGASGLGMEVCEFHQFMWSHPNNSPYYGLCGFFDGSYNMTDDFQGRMNEKYLLSYYSIPSFSFIWLTADQPNNECPSISRKLLSLCKQNGTEIDEHRMKCNETIFGLEFADTQISFKEGSILTEACAFDLCMVSQNTEDDILEISEWLNGPVRAYALRLIQEEITEAGCEYDSRNYSEGFRREKDCYFYRCKLGEWIQSSERVPSCCVLEGKYYEHLEKFYSGCNEQICQCGNWSLTTEKDPNCCMHKGQLYPDGEEISVNCYMKVCTKGSWVKTGYKDPNCPPSEPTHESEASGNGCEEDMFVLQVKQEVNFGN